jgi:outer membrane protein TolC
MTMKLKWMGIAAVGLGIVGIPLQGLAGEPPTLSECIETALKVNPDLRSASARLEEARAAVKEASSAYYPQLGLAGSWTRTDNPPQAFFMSLNQRRASLEKDFNNPDDIENARGSIVAQWRVCDGGRRMADKKAAKMGAQTAEYSIDTVRNDLVFQITRAYYGILQARGFVAVREEAVKSISENLRIATERFKAGGALKTDPLNLEVQLSQAREDLIRARNGLQLAVAALNTAIGKPLLDRADVSALPDQSDRTDRLDRADQSADIEARPEWHAAQSQVKMAQALATRARREYLPVISAFGSVDWDTEPFRGAEQSYIAGAAIELNIFDGFRTRSGVARASAGVVTAQAQADKLRDLLALDLTQSQLNEAEARERLEVAGKSLSGATESLRITEERFKQGAADITELMTAQVGLTATRTRRVAAQYDILIAQADVARARGELSRIHKEERK